MHTLLPDLIYIRNIFTSKSLHRGFIKFSSKDSFHLLQPAALKGVRVLTTLKRKHLATSLVGSCTKSTHHEQSCIADSARIAVLDAMKQVVEFLKPLSHTFYSLPFVCGMKRTCINWKSRKYMVYLLCYYI